jgi:hypothetical protein
LLAACFKIVSCLAFSSTLKMPATCSSETVEFQRTTWHYIPEYRTLHKHSCEDLKTYTMLVLSFFRVKRSCCTRFVLTTLLQNLVPL